MTDNPDNLPDYATRMQDLLGGMNNIANSIAEAGGVASQFPFIGINGDGVWAYGQDRVEVQEGSLWAIDIRTWQHGFIAWPPNTSKERKPLAERMVSAGSPLPNRAELPNVGVEYQLQFAFELLCLTGEDSGQMAIYKNGSYGAKVIVQSMVEEVKKQARTDPTRMCPVVELQIRSYFHNEWKKTIYNPVLHIHRWISFGEYDKFERSGDAEAAPVTKSEPAIVTPVPEPEVRAAARGNGRRAAAPEPEPAPAPAAGRRRPRVQPTA